MINTDLELKLASIKCKNYFGNHLKKATEILEAFGYSVGLNRSNVTYCRGIDGSYVQDFLIIDVGIPRELNCNGLANTNQD